MISKLSRSSWAITDSRREMIQLQKWQEISRLAQECVLKVGIEILLVRSVAVVADS